jgi:hypothetical protein
MARTGIDGSPALLIVPRQATSLPPCRSVASSGPDCREIGLDLCLELTNGLLGRQKRPAGTAKGHRNDPAEPEE